ncbi:7697_t:CDS:1, partial [Entrophospora sp. SA101]
MLTSTLDPRFKHLKFLDERTHLRILQTLKIQYELIKEQQQHDSSPSGSPSCSRSVILPSRNNSNEKKISF